VRAGTRLRTTGVYRVVRHPSEAGTLAVAAGASALLSSPWALALAGLVLLPLVVVRVRREDVVLAREIGAPFRAYARRVGGLLPHLRVRSGFAAGDP
jgi:protein-S-isoprenylcysteine O-methyltransferase